MVTNATHCDLYDGGEGNYIPWNEITTFLNDHLKWLRLNKKIYESKNIHDIDNMIVS